MLDKQTIQAIREQLAPDAAPVLSLYLNVNPAEPGNRQKASVLRARTALEGLDIPDGLRREILRRLDQEHVIPEGRTLVLFSGEDPKKLFRLEYLHEELPLLNLDASDGALARWGTPFVAPILFAADQTERYAVIYASQGLVRCFEAFMGDIREAWSSFRDTDTEDWTRVTEARHQPGQGNPVTARGGRDVDTFADRMATMTGRFYKGVVDQFLEDDLSRDAGRLILLGTPDALKAFEDALPQQWQDRIVARLSGPKDDSVVAASWYPLIADSIREAENAAEEELLDRIRERGSWGRSEVLNLLNNGQVDILALPFDVDLRVWLAEESQTLAPTEEALRMQRPDDEYREVRLTDVLSELVRRHSFRVEFMDGPQEEKLKADFRGIAALRRW